MNWRLGVGFFFLHGNKKLGGGEPILHFTAPESRVNFDSAGGGTCEPPSSQAGCRRMLRAAAGVVGVTEGFQDTAALQ